MTLRLCGVLLIAATVLTAAACGASTGGDHDSVPDAATNDGAADSRAAIAPEVAGEPNAGGSAALDSVHKVIFSSELTLETSDVAARFLEIGRIATARGGFVADSQLIQREADGNEQSYATITIRVPSAALDDVLNQLRTLDGVSVRSERSTAQEVTEEYTDLSSRLRNLERSEQQYLVLLDRASSIQDILTVSERIDGVRAEIERIEGRLQVLDDLVDLATISIALEPITPTASTSANGGGFSSAWADAWDAVGDFGEHLAATGAWALVIAICATPMAMVAGGMALFGRRRHPRPSAS